MNITTSLIQIPTINKAFFQILLKCSKGAIYCVLSRHLATSIATLPIQSRGNVSLQKFARRGTTELRKGYDGAIMGIQRG